MYRLHSLPKQSLFVVAVVCVLFSGCNAYEQTYGGSFGTIKENPFVIVRWVFNYFLTPVAVIIVFWTLLKNILRITEEGFKTDTVEGYKRVCAAVLPFAVFVYAVIMQQAGGDAANEDFIHDISNRLASFSSLTLVIASAGAGVGIAVEMFQMRGIGDVILRIVLLLLSAITCFVAFMFVSVGIAPGINVVFGLLIGFCATAVMLPHKS